MVTLPVILILFPFVASIVLFITRSENIRRAAVVAATSLVCIGTMILAVRPALFPSIKFPINHQLIEFAGVAIEIAMSTFIIFVGIRARNFLIVVLALAQAALMLWFDWKHPHIEVARNLFIDPLAIIMALINGLVGSGICLYALDYMREYHTAHAEIKDRRPLFFAELFLFMGAICTAVHQPLQAIFVGHASRLSLS